MNRLLLVILVIFAFCSMTTADPGPRLVYQIQVPGLTTICTVEPIFDGSGRITSFVASEATGDPWQIISNPFVYLIDTIGNEIDSLLCSRGLTSYYSDFQFCATNEPGVTAKTYVSYLSSGLPLGLTLDVMTFGNANEVRQVYKADPFSIGHNVTYISEFWSDRDDFQLTISQLECASEQKLLATIDVSSFTHTLPFYSEDRSFQTATVDLVTSTLVDTTSARFTLTGQLLNDTGCATLNIFTALFYYDADDEPGVQGDYTVITSVVPSPGSVAGHSGTLEFGEGIFIEEALSGDFDTETPGDEVLILGMEYKVNNFKYGSPFSALYSFVSGSTVQLWSRNVSGRKMLKDASSDFVAVLGGNNNAEIPGTVLVYSIRPDFAGIAQTFTFPVPLYYADIVQAPDGTSPLYLVGADSNTIYVYDLSIITDVDGQNDATLPTSISLSQNYPNPFNPTTTISFDLEAASIVRLMILNTLGQQVRELVTDQYSSGTHKIEWDGRDDFGESVASGVYFYSLSAGEVEMSKKMVLLK